MNINKLLLNPRSLLLTRRLVKNFPFTRASIQEIQFRRLKRLLVDAYENIPFYRQRMDSARFSPYNFSDMAEYQKLPILTKNEYRAFVEDIVSADPKKYKHWHQDGTNGSTGTPMQIYRTWEERAYILAKWLRAIIINGYSFRQKTCLITRRKKIERDSWAQALGIGKRYALCFTDSFDHIIDKYSRLKPEFLYANKSHILLLAQAIRERNIEIPQPLLYAVASETLDKSSKSVIQGIFGESNMFEVYGAIELGGNLAFQVKGTPGMHFCHDTNILELDHDGLINDKQGYSVITDLYTRSFPLIRYRLGDWIEMREPDGDTMPLINTIKGREDDWIFLPNGTKISFINFNAPMKDRLEIVQFRIIQEVTRKITIQVVLKDGISKDEYKSALIKDLKNDVSPELDYDIEFLDRILPDPNGKIRIVINKAARQE